MTYPSSRVATYTYSSAGRLASVATSAGTTTYSYDAAGRQTGQVRPNGVTTTTGYDAAGRVTSIVHAQGGAMVSPLLAYGTGEQLSGVDLGAVTAVLRQGTTLESITYTLDALGRPTTMTDSSGSTGYTYNGAGQLTQDGGTTYTYDAAGNRVSKTAGTTTTYTYDDAGRLTAAGSTTYTNDGAGRRTSQTTGGSTTTYSYDTLDRLTGLSGAQTASYTYDGDGTRMVQTSGGTTTTYTRDRNGHMLSDGCQDYVQGRELISREGCTATIYAGTDAQGSVRQLTSSSGTVSGSAKYDQFGKPTAQSGAQLPQQFGGGAGAETDGTGLVMVRNGQYYDPEVARMVAGSQCASGVMRVGAGAGCVSGTAAAPVVWAKSATLCPGGALACMDGVDTSEAKCSTVFETSVACAAGADPRRPINPALRYALSQGVSLPSTQQLLDAGKCSASEAAQCREAWANAADPTINAWATAQQEKSASAGQSAQAVCLMLLGKPCSRPSPPPLNLAGGGLRLGVAFSGFEALVGGGEPEFASWAEGKCGDLRAQRVLSVN